MAHTRDLYKTKLCTLYQRGNCPRQTCSFAHGEAELRRFPGAGGGFIGRQENHRTGDLRERLDRRCSPAHRRFSSTRDGRGGRQGNLTERRFLPRYRDHSHTRSPARRRASSSYTPPSERKESKRLLAEGAPDAHLSDVSGDHYGEENDTQMELENVKSAAVSPSASPRKAFQEQLRQVQLENEALLDEKDNLEKALGKKVEEASALTTQNTDLENKLHSSQQEYKRYRSKMRKMIKVYVRYAHAQEEVKKTHFKLQRMAAEDFPKDERYQSVTHVDDSGHYNLSDGEIERSPNAVIPGGLSTLNIAPSKTVNITETTAVANKRKRLHSVREKTRASIQNMQQNGGNLRQPLENDANFNAVAAPEKPSKVDVFTSADTGSSKQQQSESDISPSCRSSPVDKAKSRHVRLKLSATGLAAHARDLHHEAERNEERCVNTVSNDRERVPLNLNMPPIKSFQSDGGFFRAGHRPTQYSKFSGEDEADVNGGDTDMDEHVGVEAHESSS